MRKPRIQAGDEPAQRNLYEDQQNDAERGTRFPAVDPAAWCADAQRNPNDRRIDGSRQCEMRRKTVLADVRAIGKPALHHVPPERPLRAAQSEKQDHASCGACLEALRRP